MNRRELLKAGAWAAPVILLATAAPAAAASTVPCPPQTYIYDPRLFPNLNGGVQNNAVKITIVTGSHVEFEYLRDMDLVDINIRGQNNYRLPERVSAGFKVIRPLNSCQDPEWIQVHGNNVHYYGGGKFA